MNFLKNIFQMALNENQKNNVKIITRALINLDMQKTQDLNITKLAEYVRLGLATSHLDGDKDDIADIVQALEYEVSVQHTTGSAIFDDYGTDTHDWYNKLIASNLPQPFWDRYSRYLTEKSSLDQKSIDLLDKTTLPNILNCFSNPNEKFDGKRLKRGLIIGDVQSGKTSTYIGLICKAADAGYKVIILLAGTTEALRQQTQERVDEGLVGYTFPKDPNDKDYKDGKRIGVGIYTDSRPAAAFTSVQRDFVAGSNKLATTIDQHNSIVVFVCKKNVSVLTKLHDWLKEQNIDIVKGYVDAPMLLIDDEADNASVNTKKDETDPTKTNKIIRNICNLFKNSTYVGFTATPFANIFIDPDSIDSMKHADLFPENFIYSLPTPTTYIGARRIFNPEGDHYSSLCYISDIKEYDYTSDEYKDLAKNHVDTLNSKGFYFLHKKEWNGILPKSLRESILCFFLANALRDLRGDSSAPRSMLINMSRFIKVQQVIKEYVERVYNEVYNTIKFDFDDTQSKNNDLPLYKELHDVLDAHFSDIVDYRYLEKRVLDKKTLLHAISDITIIVVNGSRASNSLDYKTNPNLRVIAVGGLALSRGLTLEGLLVSYFYRNTATFDVLMQMGRWFGYRNNYDDIFRIWTSQSSALWYDEIATASELLKNDIKNMFDQNLTPKDFGLKVRNSNNDLQITASNKMRSASNYKLRISYYGNIYDTPYLSLNAEHNKQNLQKTQELTRLLLESGYKFHYADVERHKNHDPYSKGIGDSRYFDDVPKSIIREFLTKIRCSLLNMNFNVETILSFINNPDNTGLDYWDVVFEGGDAVERCQIKELSLINCVKRAIYCHDNAAQISSRRRILGTREGKFCLSTEEIDLAENTCKKVWYDQGERDMNKSIPVKAYFQYLKTRKPVLIIMLIQPEFKHGEKNKKNTPAFENYVKEIGDNQLIAYAIGFPGVRGEEAAVPYKVNKIWMQANGLDTDDDNLNTTEYDEEYDG